MQHCQHLSAYLESLSCIKAPLEGTKDLCGETHPVAVDDPGLGTLLWLGGAVGDKALSSILYYSRRHPLALKVRFLGTLEDPHLPSRAVGVGVLLSWRAQA